MDGATEIIILKLALTVAKKNEKLESLLQGSPSRRFKKVIWLRFEAPRIPEPFAIVTKILEVTHGWPISHLVFSLISYWWLAVFHSDVALAQGQIVTGNVKALHALAFRIFWSYGTWGLLCSCFHSCCVSHTYMDNLRGFTALLVASNMSCALI